MSEGTRARKIATSLKVCPTQTSAEAAAAAAVLFLRKTLIGAPNRRSANRTNMAAFPFSPSETWKCTPHSRVGWSLGNFAHWGSQLPKFSLCAYNFMVMVRGNLIMTIMNP